MTPLKDTYVFNIDDGSDQYIQITLKNDVFESKCINEVQSIVLIIHYYKLTQESCMYLIECCFTLRHQIVGGYHDNTKRSRIIFSVFAPI